MLRNRPNWKTVIFTIKLLSLSAAFLVQTACGGGGASEASALGIPDVTIAFIKRPTPRDNNNNILTNDIRQPATFEEGGDLYLLSLTDSTSDPINITKSITYELGDVKGVSVSYDGTKLVFSLRIPDPNDGSIISWNLYEYDITNNSLTALISPGIRDNGDDISPRYLPDGRIIFASTRQTESKGVRVNEGRGSFTALDENHLNFAFSLHVLNANGTIKQVSFNESNDLDPIVLRESGRVLFSRWNNMGNRNDISLYSMNPDGTDVQLYYGAHSHTNANLHFYKPQEVGNGQIMAIFRPFVTNFGGGSIILIDGKNFADNTQPIWSQQGMISGPAQTAFTQNVLTPTGLSLNGRYNAAFPILDGTNRYLMSWNPCQILNDPTIPFDPLKPKANIIPCTLATQTQLNDINVIEAPPNFSIVLVSPNSSQVPLFNAISDTLLSEVVITYTTQTPPIIFDKIPGVAPEMNLGLADDGVGVLHIHSVYDFDNNFSAYAANLPTLDNDGMPITINTPAKMANPKNATADQRPARFVRITKGVSIPDPDIVLLDDSAYGVSTQQGMREIVGYAPIEPDGSVKIKVPANVPLTIGVLDKDGRRISNRHQSWFQVKPGETLECIGCHVHDTANQNSNKPHGRPDTTSTFNPGATTTGIGFPFSLDSLWAEMGETMAETRARQSCLPTNPIPCEDMKPSTDLIYADVWTDDVAANRSADPSFTIDYTTVPISPLASGDSTATACGNGYNNLPTSFTNCRVVINYVQHIQPIWEEPRAPNSCVTCHNAGNVVNAGQLDLTSSTSDLEANHLTSYQELLSDDAGISPSMSTAGARNSLFMELMTGENLNNDASQPTDTQNHNLMLAPSELKLIAEWLDMGAQYFNNPFDPAVPTN